MKYCSLLVLVDLNILLAMFLLKMFFFNVGCMRQPTLAVTCSDILLQINAPLASSRECMHSRLTRGTAVRSLENVQFCVRRTPWQAPTLPSPTRSCGLLYPLGSRRKRYASCSADSSEGFTPCWPPTSRAVFWCAKLCKERQ